jgi:hypothetical protein
LFDGLNTLFGRTRYRLEDSILMDLKDIIWEGVDWSDLAYNWDQWQICCEYGHEPSDSIKGWEILDKLSSY